MVLQFFRFSSIINPVKLLSRAFWRVCKLVARLNKACARVLECAVTLADRASVRGSHSFRHLRRGVACVVQSCVGTCCVYTHLLGRLARPSGRGTQSEPAVYVSAGFLRCGDSLILQSSNFRKRMDKSGREVERSGPFFFVGGCEDCVEGNPPP